MPPKTKFSKQEIINATFEIAKREGVLGITAQKIAKELKSSVAPIYVNFTDIEALKKEVIKKVFMVNEEMNNKVYTGSRFLDFGVASLKFANEYSVLFHEFLTNQKEYGQNYDKHSVDKEVIEEMKKDVFLKDLKLSDRQLMDTLLKMRVFTIGLATSFINKILPEETTEQDCIRMMKEVGESIINGIKEKRCEQDNNISEV